MISERAAEIFHEANTLDPSTRSRFVNDVCGDDPALLKEVNTLLAAANQSEVYFEKLAGKVSLEAFAKLEEPLPPNKIVGQWRLLKRIGRGGMGVVYLAERADEQFEQQAALKILPTGLDSEQARARFLVERQILASLVHDNIARLLDGGVTEDGVPYFVMDYVDGLPIDEYFAQRKPSIEQCLELILEISEAVQFAHRNLIIHRDLKPNNVLVTKAGRVRLLDFGIAKILEPSADGADLTKVAQRPVTPAFSSPEMLRGEPVDVTTDVYSIGALMYTLLTRKAPLRYDGMSLAEMYDHATNTIPPPMSRVNPNLPEDLDAIVAKALGKLPEERYASVESLSNDIRHYLAGQPVTAKAPSSWYRARKFVGRHRVGTIFAMFAVISLAAITGLAVNSAITSERQTQQIALERDRAEETISFLVSIFDSADPNIEPSELTARQILESGRQRAASELADQPAVQAELLKAMSQAYQSLRLIDEGIDVLERERQLRSTLNGERSSEYADVLIRLAQINDMRGDYQASLAYAEQALTVSQELRDLPAQAAAHTRIGRIHHLQGDYDNAGPGYRQALEIYSSEYGDDSLQVAQSRSHLGNLLNHQASYVEAIWEFEEALRIRRLYYEGDHSEITEILLGLAQTQANSNKLEAADETYQTAFAMNDRLFGPDNSYNLYIMSGLGKLAEQRGEYDLAIFRFEETIRLINLHTPQSPNLGIAHAYIGRVNMRLEKYDSAIAAYREAVAILEKGLPDHWLLGDVRWRLGRCLIETGQFEEAESLILTGINTLENQWGADDQRTIDARAAAALLYESWGRPEKIAIL